MKIKQKIGALGVVVLCAVLSGCQQPVDSFSRTSDRDPVSPAFTPSESSELSYELNGGSLVLSWQDQTESATFLDGYFVEKAINDSINFTQIDKLPATATSFEDTDIGHFYLNYRISPYVTDDGKAYRSDYKSLFLNRYQPEYLYFYLETEKQTEVYFEHKPPAGVDVKGYELQRWRSDGSGNEFAFETVAQITDLSADKNQTFIDTTTVRDGYHYDYRIRAYSDHGKSLFTETHCCYSGRYHVEPPRFNDIRHVSESSVSLHWSDIHENAEGTVIERSSNGTGFDIVGRAPKSSNSFVDTGLDPQNTYTYRLRSYGSDYSTNYSIQYGGGASPDFKLPEHTNNAAVALRPKRSEYATAGDLRYPDYDLNSSLQFWEESSTERYERFTLLGADIVDIEFTSDGEHLVYGIDNGTVKTYNTEVFLNTTTYHPDGDQNFPVTSLSLKPGDYTAAIGYEDDKVRVISFEGVERREAPILLHTLQLASSVTYVAYNPRGTRLAVATQSGNLVIYDVSGNGYQQISKMQAHSSAIHQVAFSPDGRQLVSCSDSEITVWEGDDITKVTELDDEISLNGALRTVTFSADGGFIFAGTTQGELVAWEKPGFTLVQQLVLPGGADAGIYDMDVKSNLLLTASYNGKPILWSISSNQWIRTN